MFEKSTAGLTIQEKLGRNKLLVEKHREKQ
jgi:hypothetical protein